MTFPLHVMIGGLMVLVRDEKAGVVHVLAPSTDGGHAGGHNHVAVHDTKLIADPRHGVTPVVLKGYQCDLTGIATDSGKAPQIPSSVLNLGDTTSNGSLALPAAFTEGEPRDPKVAAHVKLSGGTIEVRKTARFQLDPGPEAPTVELACLVEWRAEVSGDSVPSKRLTPLRPSGGGNKTTPKIRADGEGVSLGIITAVGGNDFPDAPGILLLPTAVYDSSDHFDAYFQFWGNVAHKSPRKPDATPLPPTYPRICPSVQASLGE